MKAYLFGYLSAFTLWFGELNGLLSFDSMMSTFAGPFNLLGLIERDLGFYSPISINNDTSTNIYTAIRGLISDFTIIGSIIFIFIIGIYFQLLFQKKSINTFEGIIPLSIFYSFTLYSPLISIFHYNSIFFSWILIFCIFKFK